MKKDAWKFYDCFTDPISMHVHIIGIKVMKRDAWKIYDCFTNRISTRARCDIPGVFQELIKEE